MNFLNLIFPKRCVVCGRVGRYICSRCASAIRIIEVNETICPECQKPAIGGAKHPRCRGKYVLDGLTSFFHYDGVVKKAIKAIKYRFVSDLVKELVLHIPQVKYDQINQNIGMLRKPIVRQTDTSHSLQQGRASLLDKDKVIFIPIPLHKKRLRFRGFNQSELLGHLIADALGLRMRTDILKRRKLTVPQVEMKSRKSRLKNMNDVFLVNNVAMQQCSNATVILFDDVYTTGATLRFAANVLKRAGIQYVWGVTLAR